VFVTTHEDDDIVRTTTTTTEVDGAKQGDVSGRPRSAGREIEVTS